MGYHYMRRGLVSVVMDNPCFGELGHDLRKSDDANKTITRWLDHIPRVGIWAGRCYEAISVFQKACVLKWLIQQSFVDARRVATSGHSLGAKPADILAVLYPDLVRAVVHNDFVCNWQERSVAMVLATSGNCQIVPGIFQWFDYTDLEASLAPRPLLFTEGGRANQIAKIRSAYELVGAPEAMRLCHYEKYSAPNSRPLDGVELPIGITGEQYSMYACVDKGQHRFRPERAVPWLADVFGM